MEAITLNGEATLLRLDGTEFYGSTIVKKLKAAYNRRRGVVVEYADNSIGYTEMGNPQARIDSFTIECFSPLAAAQIQSAITDDVEEGRFRLEVPNIGISGGKRYTIRFFEASFDPQSPRRGSGELQLFSAQVSNVQVLSETVY